MVVKGQPPPNKWRKVLWKWVGDAQICFPGLSVCQTKPRDPACSFSIHRDFGTLELGFWEPPNRKLPVDSVAVDPSAKSFTFCGFHGNPLDFPKS